MNLVPQDIVYRPVINSLGYSPSTMTKPELPSDLPTTVVNAAALLLDALWVQEQRAALDRDRLDLAMREAKLAGERVKLVQDRADLARERAAHESQKSERHE